MCIIVYNQKYDIIILDLLKCNFIIGNKMNMQCKHFIKGQGLQYFKAISGTSQLILQDAYRFIHVQKTEECPGFVSCVFPMAR